MPEQMVWKTSLLNLYMYLIVGIFGQSKNVTNFSCVHACNDYVAHNYSNHHPIGKINLAVATFSEIFPHKKCPLNSNLSS